MLLLDILFSSIAQGAIYVISALGIVLIYKTTRVMNFAHGYMAALGGYIAYQVAEVAGQPFAVGVLVGVLVGAALGLLVDRLLMGPLASRSHLELVIVTVGISFILQAVVERIWGYDEHGITKPFAGKSIHIGGVDLGLYNVLLAVAGVVAVALLTVLLRYTAWGLRLRATFDDPVGARLSGIRVNTVRNAAWILGGGLAGASGALLAPVIYLSPERFPLILILSFCGAVIGGLTSLPGTIVGGIGAALVFQLGSAYVSINYSTTLLYAAIIVLLWLRPNGIFGDGSDNVEARPEGERGVGLAQWLASRRRSAKAADRFATVYRLAIHVAVGAFVLVVLPAAMGTTITAGTFLATFISVLGVSVGMAYAGQIVFGQVAFMMIGMYVTAKVIGTNPDRWWLGLLAGVVVTALVTLAIGIPTARLRGAYFAIVTLALALAATEIAFNWTSFTGGYTGVAVMRPVELTGWSWYLVMAVIAMIVYYGLIAFRSSELGRRMVAARDDAEGAEAMGISVWRWRLTTFVITGTLGGLAGSIYALNVGYVGAMTLDFHFSMLLFVAAVVARSITMSVLGAALVIFVPLWLAGSQSVVLVVFGLVLIATMFVLPKDVTHLDVIRMKMFRKRAQPEAAEPTDSPESLHGGVNHVAHRA